MARKLTIPSTDATETKNLNFKLREENNLLQNQLKIANDSLSEWKEVIKTLENERLTLISTIGILQRNNLKPIPGKAYEFRAVGTTRPTTTEAVKVKSSESTKQKNGSVTASAKKNNQGSKTKKQSNRRRKKNKNLRLRTG